MKLLVLAVYCLAGTSFAEDTNGTAAVGSHCDPPPVEAPCNASYSDGDMTFGSCRIGPEGEKFCTGTTTEEPGWNRASDCVCDPQGEYTICEKCGRGLFLIKGDGEHAWDNNLRIMLYFFGLMWMFLAVGIVADVFMAAIEVITSQQVETKTKDGRTILITVWNETVANLSLMALGSSAPEILLSVIEIVAGGFYSGALGPSTIVGSAAFNLLCISAVCVNCIPEGENRHINAMDVFLVTAFFSIFALISFSVFVV